MNKVKQKFSWDGVSDETTGQSGIVRDKFLENEIFTLDCYEHVYPVKEGDVVLDLGASIGPFTWKVMDKASKVYAVEPMADLIPTIKKNTDGFNVEIINKALSYENGEIGMTDECINTFDVRNVKTTDFKTLLKDNNITKLDYIKTDCEGGEYFLFRDENIPFLKSVRSIVGEFHLRDKIHNIEFRYFRDKFLPQFKNFEVYSLDKVNIKWDLYNEHFLDYYNEVMIHINNE
tara:strand:+ start:384 stop:1079 length:696 start_codon:yes stop_codon:yes gene_type:complete